jgi:hypothetical protein
MVELEHSTVHSETHWASVHQSVSQSVDETSQPVRIYLQNINFILFIHCLMLMIKIVGKHADVFSLHSTRRWDVIHASPSLRLRIIDCSYIL